MGRSPCCSKVGLRRGPWSAMEDSLLTNFIQHHGEGQWRSLPKRAGLLRCGKSCRLRWMNYLRPGIKRGNITQDEEDLILRLHALLGNRWSLIAGRLPGRTDNEIKNYWNTHLLKKLNPDLPKPQPPKQKQKPDQNNAPFTAAGVEKENDPPPHNNTRLYLPKPIRVTSDFSRSRTTSYDSLASEKPVLDDMPMDWPPLLQIQDATYGVDIISDAGEDHFLATGEFALPLLTHSDFISDDVEMLEKVYDEYLQLLE